MASIDLATDRQYLGALSRLRARVSLAELVGPERRSEVDAINWQLDPWTIGKATVALHRQVRAAALGATDLDPEMIQRAALVDARGWEALASVEDGASAFGALINSAVGYSLGIKQMPPVWHVQRSAALGTGPLRHCPWLRPPSCSVSS